MQLMLCVWNLLHKVLPIKTNLSSLPILTQLEHLIKSRQNYNSNNSNNRPIILIRFIDAANAIRSSGLAQSSPQIVNNAFGIDTIYQSSAFANICILFNYLFLNGICYAVGLSQMRHALNITSKIVWCGKTAHLCDITTHIFVFTWLTNQAK